MGSRRDIRGASIIIALSMIAAIMFFTIGMASTMILAIQNTADSKKALQSEYAAQSGVELANYVLKGLEPATAVPGTVVTQPLDANSSVEYSVKGKDDDPLTLYNTGSFPGYRSVPIKGTGNASSNCTNLEDPDDPCNWNKLYFGDSIEVPLYYINPTTGVVTNFSSMNITAFTLRVRVSCVGAQVSGCARYTIDSAQTTDQVLTWQVAGESCGKSSCVAGPAPGYYITGDVIKDRAINYRNRVLEIGNKCQDALDPITYNGSVYKFLKNSAPWTGNSLNKPKFKLSYVKKLLGTSSSIPYLEYQFLYDKALNYPLVATYKVTVDGYANGFKFNLSGVQGLNSGLFDFAVQN